MKKFLFFLMMLVTVTTYSQTSAPDYDSVLAKSLGADDYGMKKYMFVLLRTGPKTITDKALQDTIFKEHLNNINRLAEEGKLVVAGPFLKNDKSYRGIFILNLPTKEEAEKLLLTDRAIKEQLLKAEIIPWYGSAALPIYLNYSKKIEKLRH